MIKQLLLLLIAIAIIAQAKAAEGDILFVKEDSTGEFVRFSIAKKANEILWFDNLGAVNSILPSALPIGNATQTELDKKANLNDLSTVATTGNYSDLVGKPVLNFEPAGTTGTLEDKLVDGSLIVAKSYNTSNVTANSTLDIRLNAINAMAQNAAAGLTSKQPLNARLTSISGTSASGFFYMRGANLYQMDIAQGSILTGSGDPSLYSSIAIGTAGQYLQSNGTQFNWVDLPEFEPAGAVNSLKTELIEIGSFIQVDSARNADNALTAGNAATADNAAYATNAGNADNAVNATNAESANYAIDAGSANQATAGGQIATDFGSINTTLQSISNDITFFYGNEFKPQSSFNSDASSEAVAGSLLYNSIESKASIADLQNGVVVPSTAEYATIAGSADTGSLLETQINAKANLSDLATVATTGNYSDLIGKPNYATTAQGNLADAAMPRTGGNFTGRIVMPDLINNNQPSFNIPQTTGTATVFTNGDMWINAAGLYVRVNGASRQLLYGGMAGNPTIAGTLTVSGNLTTNSNLSVNGSLSVNNQTLTTDASVITRALGDLRYQPKNTSLTNISALTTTAYGLSLLEATDNIAAQNLLNIPNDFSNYMQATDYFNVNGGVVLGSGANIGSGLGVAIGASSSATDGGAIGYSAKSTTGGAIGYYALTTNGFAGGDGAWTYDPDNGGVAGNNRVQLGNGLNETDNTIQFLDAGIVSKTQWGHLANSSAFGGSLFNTENATTAKGLIGIESATTAETIAGTDNTKYVTPLSLSNKLTKLDITVNGGDLMRPLVFALSSPIVSLTSNTTQIIAETVLGAFNYTETAVATLPVNNRLTSISFNNIQGLNGIFNITTAANVVSFGFPELLFTNSTLAFSTLNSLTSLNFPKLIEVGGVFTIQSCASLASINAPELTTVYSGFNPNNNNILASINMPKLRKVSGQVGLYTCPLMTNYSLPSLEICLGFTMQGSNPALTTLSFPKLKYCYGIIDIYSNTSLANFTLPINGDLKAITQNITMTGNALTAASVENILVAVATLDGTNGTTAYTSGKIINLSGGTSSGTAALTPAAIVARDLLLSRGITVTLNP